jgi:(S)-mandelate dehydrogenase
MKSEIDTTLAQIGCADINRLSRDYLWTHASIEKTTLRTNTHACIES